MSNKITIYDIANAMGVSPATVSRSLNDHPSISSKTKKRIVLHARKVGYRTNKFAANLSHQKSNAIGVIVPKLNSYFMSTVLSGIEIIANDQGYNLIISQSFESELKEKLNAQTLFDSGVDALMVSLAFETATYDHFTTYREHNIPLLFFDRVQQFKNCPNIVIDNLQAGFDATEHLIQQGCTNILHVCGNLKRNVYGDRFEGFKKALHTYGLKYEHYNLLRTNLDLNDANVFLEHLKSSKVKFDGIFVSNDTMAVACMRSLLEIGVKIPEQMKIVGFNNDPISEIISPNLSTVDYPGYKMGELAGQSIINHLKGNINIQSAETIVLNHRLIIRESSSKK